MADQIIQTTIVDCQWNHTKNAEASLCKSTYGTNGEKPIIVLFVAKVNKYLYCNFYRQ